MLAATVIFDLARDREAAIRAAADELRAGGLVVTPTDTVYGLAADAFARGATAKVFALKNRPRSLPLPVLVARPRTAWALASAVPRPAADLAAAFWPGPLTMILPAGELDFDLGNADGTIAVRMPAHADLIALLEATGPLAVTSANLSGEPTGSTIAEIEASFGDQVEVYLDGGPAPLASGSTIVDLTGSGVKIVREGPIPAAAVLGAID